MTSKASKRAVDAVALHWTTHYGFVFGVLPNGALDAASWRAVDDIATVQCHNSERRALDLLEEIIYAPIPGDRLAQRYEAFWAWTEAGRPKRYSPPSPSLLRDIRTCIRANVRGAA